MELTGQKRQVFGKKTKNLRYERKLPAVIFGKGLESLAVTIDYNDFIKTYKEAGETSVIDLNIDGKNHSVLIKEMQFHHLNGQPIHVGFYEVDLTQKITANIPVEVINEEENELVRAGEALVLTLVNEIEVEALPNDLPNHFVIDATKLVDMDSVITLEDLDYDRNKVEIVLGEEEDASEMLVAKLDYAQMAEEEEEEISEEEAMENLEATGEKGDDEDGSSDTSDSEESSE